MFPKNTRFLPSSKRVFIVHFPCIYDALLTHEKVTFFIRICRKIQLIYHKKHGFFLTFCHFFCAKSMIFLFLLIKFVFKVKLRSHSFYCSYSSRLHHFLATWVASYRCWHDTLSPLILESPWNAVKSRNIPFEIESHFR